MMGNGFGGGAMMWLFGPLTVVGVVLLVIVAVRVFGGGISRTTPTPDAPPETGVGSQPRHGRAREILDERYARGDITTEEYQERQQALDGDR